MASVVAGRALGSRPDLWCSCACYGLRGREKRASERLWESGVQSTGRARNGGAPGEGGECVGWREMEDVERQHTARWPEAVRRAGRRAAAWHAGALAVGSRERADGRRM